MDKTNQQTFRLDLVRVAQHLIWASELGSACVKHSNFLERNLWRKVISLKTETSLKKGCTQVSTTEQISLSYFQTVKANFLIFYIS